MMKFYVSGMENHPLYQFIADKLGFGLQSSENYFECVYSLRQL